ncbi:MAG: LacI family transcriptional regulator [Oscillibacter sp.]|nr:LacI family transcriptional regulator [Oscillibacter sp.]
MKQPTESSSSAKQTAAQTGKRPTSRDVALAAGVSQSSVCRVFDEKWSDRIRPALRQHVLETAAKLGYRPNAIARSLTAQRSGIIGVVVSEDFNEFYYDILRRITNELQRQGLRVMVFNAMPYRDIDTVLSKLMEYQVDGIILTAAAISSVAAPFSLDLATPLVLLNIYSQTPFCSSVINDNYAGSYQMASYLYERGCRTFAYVSAEKSQYFDIPDRKLGFLDGLRERGCTDCLQLAGDYTYQSGQEIARQLFAQPEYPDCVFCSGSRMAYGLMDTARKEFQISIPEQLSVAAYDDTFASSLDSYALTAVCQGADEMVKTVLRLLMREIEGQSYVETVYTAPSIVIRGSVR